MRALIIALAIAAISVQGAAAQWRGFVVPHPDPDEPSDIAKLSFYCIGVMTLATRYQEQRCETMSKKLADLDKPNPACILCSSPFVASCYIGLSGLKDHSLGFYEMLIGTNMLEKKNISAVYQERRLKGADDLLECAQSKMGDDDEKTCRDSCGDDQLCLLSCNIFPNKSCITIRDCFRTAPTP